MRLQTSFHQHWHIGYDEPNIRNLCAASAREVIRDAHILKNEIPWFFSLILGLNKIQLEEMYIKNKKKYRTFYTLFIYYIFKKKYKNVYL